MANRLKDKHWSACVSSDHRKFLVEIAELAGESDARRLYFDHGRAARMPVQLSRGGDSGFMRMARQQRGITGQTG
jgi:hypothetical protein